MSFLGSGLDFEKFQLGDIWSKIKKNPERLFIGAIDPWSSKLWSKVTGKDYEPLVDQMGGPYGGHTFSAFGKQDGGVYGRAEEAGIDTKSSRQLHDAAHAITGLFAGNYGGQQLGGLMNGGGGGNGLFGGGNSMMNFMPTGGMPGGAQQTPGQTPPYAPPPINSQPPQQNPNFQMAGAHMPQTTGIAGLGRRAGTGISNVMGKLGQTLFPMNPQMTEGMDPEQIKAMQGQAMLQMGLGMMASAQNGGSFGQSVLGGFGQAQGSMQGRMQQAYQAARQKREETRQAANDARALEQQNLENERAANSDTRLSQRDQVEDERWEKTQEDTTEWRETQAAIDRERIQAQKVIAGMTHPTAGPLGGPRILSDAEAQQLGFAPGSVVEFDGKSHHVRQPGLKTAQQYREESTALESAEATFADLKSALTDVSKTGALVGEGKGRLGTAYGNARSAIRVLYNTGVLQPGELPMLQQALENPNSLKSLVDPWSRQQITAQIDELNKRITKNKELLKGQYPQMGGGLGAPTSPTGTVGGQNVTLQPPAPAAPQGAADFVYSGGRLTRASR